MLALQTAGQALFPTLPCSGAAVSLYWLLLAVSIFVTLLYLTRVTIRAISVMVRSFEALNRPHQEEQAKKGTLCEQIEAIATRKWKSVVAWVVFHPDEVRWVDRKGQTCLHHACLFRAPAQVVDMMLFQAPELASRQNKDGEIALHWAVRLSAPNEILKMLLSAAPESGLLARDVHGNTPLSLLWERHQESLLRLWWQGREQLLSSPAWNRIMFFFLCCHYQTLDIDDAQAARFRHLHVAAKYPCPPALFPLILHVYREEVQVVDENGRLPITVASSDAVANRCSDVQTKIQLLIAEYPDAVRMYDHSGRLPLHVALASGVTWEEGVEAFVRVDAAHNLAAVDPITGLYPFMLAAAGDKCCRLCQDDPNGSSPCNRQTQLLGTIYHLLRCDPAKMLWPTAPAPVVYYGGMVDGKRCHLAEY